MSLALPPNPPPALVRVYDVSPSEATSGAPFNGLRQNAQRQVAYMLGVQAGVAWRYDVIDNLLEKEGPELTTLYDFTPLLLDDGRVMPPIVTSSTDSFELQDRASATSAIATFTIKEPARVITVPPTWESYLVQHYTVNIADVNPALLPKDGTERDVWHDAVMQGWEDGIDQANRLFTLSLATLSRDYIGAARFNLLSHEGVLSIPNLQTGNLGIVVNSNTMVVGAKVYRIVQDATWQPSGNWQPKPGDSPVSPP